MGTWRIQVPLPGTKNSIYSQSEFLKQTLAEKKSARQQAGREIVSALRISASKIFGFDKREVQALAERIKNCVDSRNYFTADDAINFETGELYKASGTLWSCGSKLCPNCIATQARKTRKKLRDAYEMQLPRRGEKFRFITFTIPNPNKSLKITRELVDRAWCLFRKRKLFVDLFRGGAKSEEFTLTTNGYHYHIHVLVLSKFLLYNELRRVWTECVEIAFTEQQIFFKVNNKDSMLSVVVKPISDGEKAIHEVCKYITKSDSWTKMRSEDLTEIALVRRWSRMFEMFGSFRAMKQQQSEALNDDSATESILDTRDLFDGVSPAPATYWRDRVEKIGLESYVSELNQEIAEVWRLRREQLKRKWPNATFEFSGE